jgi:hypothetical protein
MFSWKQALAASAVSGDVVFTGHGDAGKGTPRMVQLTGTAATGGGSLTVKIETADDPAGTWAEKGSATVDADTLAKGGALASFSLPTGLKDYTRLNYVVTGTLTGLTVTAGIVGQSGQTNG